MKKGFLPLYLTSAVVTLAAFFWVNRFSAGISEGYSGNSINGGYLPVLLVCPFLLFFLYGTATYAMKFLKERIGREWMMPSMLGSLFAGILIFAYTLRSTTPVHEAVAAEIKALGTLTEVLLQSPYSNEIFFNFLTLVGLLLVSYAAGGMWAIKRAGGLSRQELNKRRT